jgi:hypothetical protein
VGMKETEKKGKRKKIEKKKKVNVCNTDFLCAKKSY